MQIRDIIQSICDFHEPYDEPPGTRDRYLVGDPDQACSGIAVTVCATMEVLRQAVAKGINLIIAHESVFCGVYGDVDAIRRNDIASEKLAYMKEHGLVIWRYHDHMHGAPVDPDRKRPDYIFYGICRELGWEDYVLDAPMKPTLYRIPEISVVGLAALLMEKFQLTGLRVVGNMDCHVTTVCMAEHVMGDKLDHSMKRAMEAEVFIPFEICDYTLTQYVNDGATQGKNKVLLEIGHFNCEELGMKYAASYIREILGDACQVTFIRSGDLFRYVVQR